MRGNAEIVLDAGQAVRLTPPERPDIRTVSGREATEVLSLFARDLVIREKVDYANGLHDLHSPAYRRLCNTKRIFKYLQYSVSTSELKAQFRNGCPVGLMTLGVQPTRGSVSIIYMVTMPSTHGVGSSMIEEAVRTSREQGCGGELAASVYSPARGAYLAWGFKRIDGDYYALQHFFPYHRETPFNQKWCDIGGDWYLRSRVDAWAGREFSGENSQQGGRRTIRLASV